MSRKSVPSYCLHKSTGQAYVKLDGKRIYLGKHGTPESHQRYTEELSNWQARQTEATANVTIKQLTLLYLERCKSHYQKDGKPTSELLCVKVALRELNRLYKDEPADNFSPMMLAQVRQKMVADDRERKSINRNVGRIIRCWKWGVSQGLVRVTTWQALTTLQGLQAGRTAARESEPVKPVTIADVEATLPHLGESLQGAVLFQLATAARPSEALRLRLCDLDRSGAVWLYRPESHKTQHHGKARVILCGPKAQAIIQSHVTSADPEAYVFAVESTGKPYRRDSYTTAIRRACVRAGIEPWSPNQLRHTAATEIRRAADLETCKVILGHSELRVTEIYAERDLLKAADIIGKIG